MGARRFSRKQKDGMGFKFLIVSLMVIMFVIFLIGLQIGIIVEKSNLKKKGGGSVPGAVEESNVGESIQSDIERMRGNIRGDEGYEVEIPSSGPREGNKSVDRPPMKAPGKVAVDKKPEKKSPPSGNVPEKVTGKERVYLQVGVFSVNKNAENLKARLLQLGMPVKVETFKHRKGYLMRRVLAGPYPSEDKTKKDADRIRKSIGIKPITLKRGG